jgi:hypothetical protein
MMRSRQMLALLVLAASALLPAQAAEHANHAAQQAARAPLALGVASAPDGVLWIAGVNAAGRLFLQSTRDLGRTWTAPALLDTAGDEIAAEGESRPAIAFGKGGTVIVSYTQPLSKPYTGNIRLLRSTDGGAHFSAPVTVHEDRQEITHRFASMAFDAKGDFTIVWIDKRDQARAGKGDYAGAAVYGKVSHDGGRTFGPDLPLAEHSCECCRIALAEGPGGGLVALWRHVFDGNVRDHAFLPLAELGKGAKPTRATMDGWVIAACPHHGPGLVPAADGGYHAVWFGVRPDGTTAHYGRLASDGTPVGKVRPLPDAGAEHADVLADGKRVAIVWRSFDGQATRLRAWLSNDNGAHFALHDLGSTTEENDHPRLLRSGHGFIAVWRREGAVEVHRVGN